jgi:hypothetical protein
MRARYADQVSPCEYIFHRHVNDLPRIGDNIPQQPFLIVIHDILYIKNPEASIQNRKS